MVVLEPNGSTSAKPLKSQDSGNPSGSSVPKPPPPPYYGPPQGPAAGQPGYSNVQPYNGTELRARREPPGMRFLKALCVAVLVWMLCGAFVRSLLWVAGWNRGIHGGWNGDYNIPSGVSLHRCLSPADWDNVLPMPNPLNPEGDLPAANQSAQDLQLLPPSAYPFMSKASFELPISSDSLYLLSRGAYASGSVDILTSTAQKQDSAAVHVSVYYHRQEIRDRVKLCKVSRSVGENGVGIFTPRYIDRHYPRDQVYFETVIMLPQSTRSRSPLRIKNLETDVVNTFHRVHAIAEHVVFDNISLAGSNAHISSSDLAADIASVQTSNGAILGTFNASKELSLVTSNGQVKVDVHLDNDLSSTPSKLYIETSNAPLEANINLHASASRAKSHYPQYKVDTKTSNGKLDVYFQTSPSDSTLYYKGDTSNGPANVQLHSAYQGTFKVSTSSSWIRPELRVRENVPDPSGRERKREVQYTGLYKGELTGSVKWVGERDDKELEKGTVEVENRLFRVPKYRLISDSEYFATKYALDIGGDGDSEHEYATVENQQSNAVKLDGASADEFQSFLKAVYPMVIQGELTLSKDEWLSVLKLSTQWFFNGLRKMAIEKLTLLLSQSPVEKIQLGKQYSIEAWLVAGYRELVMRYEPTTVEEAELIGLKETIQLTPIRERWIRQNYPSRSSKPTSIVSWGGRKPNIERPQSPQCQTVSSCSALSRSPSPDGRSSRGRSPGEPLPSIHPLPPASVPFEFINQLLQSTFEESFRLIRGTQSLYRTAEEKEEAKRQAEYAKEEERLRVLEDQEEKKLADLMVELEQQRKKLGVLKPADDCRSKVSTQCLAPTPAKEEWDTSITYGKTKKAARAARPI
ncbi:hypothetical protein MD484_g2129, partial [Candolleomyces efflorescens]